MFLLSIYLRKCHFNMMRESKNCPIGFHLIYLLLHQTMDCHRLSKGSRLYCETDTIIKHNYTVCLNSLSLQKNMIKRKDCHS